MVTLDDPLANAARREGFCNDRSDTGRLICWRCILFSTDTDSILAKILGKNCREASSWENASAKFECREIL